MVDKVAREAWREQLHEIMPRLFRYDPETGRLYHLERTPDMFPGSSNPERDCKRFNTRRAGREAMAQNRSGYRGGWCYERNFQAHRIAFALIHGRWPTLDIDHIDGDPQNNRPENLREVTHLENMRNRTRPANNTSGIVGVSFHKTSRKWRARIKVGRRVVSLGDFRTFEEAAKARSAASAAYGFHPNHGRAAIADTHRNGGDSTKIEAPFMSGGGARSAIAQGRSR